MLPRLIRELRSKIESHETEDPGQTCWDLKILGQRLSIQDIQGSKTCPAVFREIVRNELGLIDIKLGKGDVVIDIGANVGIPSIYLAKKFPDAKFYVFEPVQENFDNLTRNIEANQATNIVAEKMAITADGREFPMNVVLDKNSGGGTGLVANLVKDPSFSGYRHAHSMTLDQVFEKWEIEECALLKVDCEGTEHEILNHFSQWSKLKRLIAEIHLNKFLQSQGYSFEKTESIISQLGQANYKIKCIRMSE